MPRAELPFTFVIKKKYWQFRRGKLRTRLPGNPGDAEFHAKYAELVALSEAKPITRSPQSFSWLIQRYRESQEFRALAPATQLDYGKTLDLLDQILGPEPFRLTTRAMIKAVRDRHATTERKSHKIKQMVSRLYTWADEEELVPAGFNPAAGIKRLKRRVQPIVAWSEDEIDLFLSRCPLWLKTPIMLAIYTGQRREDIVKMEWSAFQGRTIRVRQSKTGELLDIACHGELQRHLVAARTGFGGPIARAANGRPFTANSLSQAVRRLVQTIPEMPPNRSLHGLRYAAAARLNAAGCTVTQCIAVLGHRTHAMAVRYMSQREASQAAILKQEQSA